MITQNTKKIKNEIFDGRRQAAKLWSLRNFESVAPLQQLKWREKTNRRRRNESWIAVKS
jgi:hypothetical protein